MKNIIASVLVLGFAAAAHAAVLVPVSSTTTPCTAEVTDAVYRVQAACWKNLSGEFRMWFPMETFKSLEETKINPAFIRNVDAACANTNLYQYADLFGETKKKPEEIATKEVEINFRHLNASACFK